MMQVKLVNAHGVVLMLPEEMAVEGWPSEREIPGTEITGRHGRRVDLPIARLRARRVRISGTMAGMDQDEADAIRSHVAGFIHQANPIKVYRHANSDKYLLCSAEGVDHRYTVGRFGGRVFTMTLTMEAAEPFLLSDEVVVEQVISGVAGQAVRVEAEAPGEYEVRMGNLNGVGHSWQQFTSIGGQAIAMGTSTPNDYYEITFFGIGISVPLYANAAKYSVVLDGTGVVNNQSITGESGTWGGSYSVSELEAGEHTLRIIAGSGTSSSSRLYLHAFDILPSSLLALDNKGSAEADVQLLIEAQEKETHADFLGKEAGSTVKNKHKAHSASSATNVLPTDNLTELDDTDYAKLSAKDGGLSTVTTSTNGLVPQNKFSYALDTSLTDIDKLRTYTKEIDIDYFGYGSGVNNGADNHEAEVLLHNRETNSWESQGYAGMSFSRNSEATVEGAVFTEVLNFAGKTSGSTAVCPHKFLIKNATSFLEPATYTVEGSDYNYSCIFAQDGVGYSTSTANDTRYIQHLFSFDLLTWIRNRFPYIGSIDVATLKTLVKKLEVTWVGYGSGEGGNGATLKSWNGTAWDNTQNNTAATPSPLFISLTDMVTGIDSTGFTHALAHSTNPADADTPSIINTDYVQLTVTVDLSTIRANQPRYVGSNYALQFDGVDDVVDTYVTRPEAGTLEGWYYFDEMANVLGAHQPLNSLMYQHLTNNGIYVIAGSNLFAYNPNMLQKKKWHHIALIWTSSLNSTSKLFIDGVEVPIFVQSPTAQFPTETIKLGRNSAVASFFKGKIDEVRIWNVARTPEQIAANMNTELDLTVPQEGLVAYYKANEGNGRILRDCAPTSVRTFEDVQKLVRSGLHKRIFRAGDLFECSFDGNPYAVRIAGLDHDKPSDSQYTHSMTLEFVDCLLDCQFDAPEALYYAEAGLAAGEHIWTQDASNIKYKFTTTQPVPAGGQIVITSWGTGNYVPTAVTTYAADRITPIESNLPVTVAESGEDTLAPVNVRGRCRYGSNNYLQSNIRAWLNSDDSTFIWTPQTNYDRPSTSAPYNGGGFLARLDPELVAVLGAVDKQVARNTVTDGGEQDLFSDKVFLLSRVETYNGSEGVTAGEKPYAYYAAMASAPTSGELAGRIKYLGESAREWWLRSPSSDSVTLPRLISLAGQLGYNYASFSRGVAPAVVIV